MLTTTDKEAINAVLDTIEKDMRGPEGMRAMEIACMVEDTSGMAGGYYRSYALPENFPEQWLVVMTNRAGRVGLFIRCKDLDEDAVQPYTMQWIAEFVDMGESLFLEVEDANNLSAALAASATYNPNTLPVVATVVARLMKGDEPKPHDEQDDLFEESLYLWPLWIAEIFQDSLTAYEDTPESPTCGIVAPSETYSLGSRLVQYIKKSRKEGVAYRIGFALLDKPMTHSDYAYDRKDYDFSFEVWRNEYAEPLVIRFANKKSELKMREDHKKFYTALIRQLGYNVFDW